jgi:lipopolysaccharide export system protein LptC
MMATMDRDLHSRVVAWAKILLPLAALALLSTLFLFARAIDPEDAIPYATVDVEDRIREPRMTAPTYSGVTSDGASLSVRAAEARPGRSDGATTAQALTARLETPDGALTDLAAASGALDDGAGILSLMGDVRMTTSTGYTVESQAMTARLDRTGLASPGAVRATGPVGTITATGMSLEQTDTPGDYVLVFKGRVRLIYTPEPAP